MSRILIPQNGGAYCLNVEGVQQWVCVEGDLLIGGPSLDKQALLKMCVAHSRRTTIPAYVVTPSYQTDMQELIGPTIIKNETHWIFQYFVSEKSVEEQTCALEVRARKFRTKLVEEVQSLINNWTRKVNIALREESAELSTLQTQLVDLETFQQALCDIPAQSGFPGAIVWPVIPASWLGVSVSGVALETYYSDHIAKWTAGEVC